MKLQLLIFTTLLVSITFALPVPDEEASPVKAVAVADVKSEVVVPKVEEKPVDIIKPEGRATEEKTSEKLEVDSYPDAEAPPQALPSKLQPIEEKKAESDKKPAAEKQIRAENAADTNEQQQQIVKALPVVEAPVSAISEDKQIAEEGKPAVHDAQPEGKSAVLLKEAESVKPTVEAADLPKTDTVGAAALEDKKDDASGRQERGTEKKDGVDANTLEAKEVPEVPASILLSEPKTLSAATETPKKDEATPAVAATAASADILESEKPAIISDDKTSPAKLEEAKSELKPNLEKAEAVESLEIQPKAAALETGDKKPADKAALSIGEIAAAPQQKAAEESAAGKDLKQESDGAAADSIAEATKKIDATASIVEPLAGPAEPQAQTDAKSNEKLAAPLLQQQLEGKPSIIEAKKASDDESKESKESGESKESEESKENKSN